MLRFRVLGASFSSFGCFVFEIWVLRFRVFGCLRRFELHSIRYRILVIALDFCCIYIGLVFIKGRPVSSVLGASFSILGASFSSFGCFVFEFWVLRFRVLGASCFGLRFRVLRFRNYPRNSDIFHHPSQLVYNLQRPILYHILIRDLFLEQVLSLRNLILT